LFFALLICCFVFKQTQMNIDNSKATATATAIANAIANAIGYPEMGRNISQESWSS
jgi:tRNA threonylcarbamoyladenosine modification (KEOPS) complex Cgi121 subunit